MSASCCSSTKTGRHGAVRRKNRRPKPNQNSIAEAGCLAALRLNAPWRNGYRKITELLRVEGWSVNHKKIERLWGEEGLQRPRRHKKRKRLCHNDSSIIRLRPQYPKHIWSIDFCSRQAE
ncbi:IS3 family transposase [Roseobacter sp. MH60115]|uniref:IS3 family transposase n=1 Tax=Roseobacter sp. MH60115 TaxID=2785324 RepID=UPI0018A2E168